MLDLWLLPVGLRIVTVGLANALQKPIAAKNGREERFMVQYVTAAVSGVLLAIYFGTFSFNWAVGAAFALGVLNSTGAYCQWRATGLSLSRYGLFAWGKDFVAMGLGAYFLAEIVYLNDMMVAGIAVVFASVICFAWRDSQRKAVMHGEAGSRPPPVFYLWLAATAIIFGTFICLMRALALKDVMSPGDYLCGQYLGALCVATVILLGKKSVRGLERLTLRDLRFGIASAIVIVAAQGLHYWSLLLAPVISTQPIFLIAETVLPVWIGVMWFGEGKGLTKLDVLLFVLGVVGAILIALSFWFDFSTLLTTVARVFLFAQMCGYIWDTC